LARLTESRLLSDSLRMAPKRKAKTEKKAAAPKKKAKPEPADSPAEPEPTEPDPSPATSKAKPGGKLTVADAWSAPYVESGVMSQTGFGELCARIELAEMSFEACYLMYLLIPSVEDVMTVCNSQTTLQRTVEKLGCRLVSDVPAKLRSKTAHMQASFDMHDFQPFFRWMFEMGKGISAMNTGAHVGAVRSVPIPVGLQLMEAVLGKWTLMGKLKAFCEDKELAPFSKDLWTQVGRFAHLTTIGAIDADLGNYEDDGSGGGTAWPCMIDDFVEYVQGGAEQ